MTTATALSDNTLCYSKHSMEQVGDMMVHNHHLVGKRILDIIGFFDQHLAGVGVYNVIFSISDPDPELLGSYHKPSNSITMFVENIFSEAMHKASSETHMNLNVVHIFWSSIMQVIGHEMIHAYHHNNNLGQPTEDEVDTGSLRMCIAAAKVMYIEPDFETSTLSLDLLVSFIRSFQEEKTEWAGFQRQLHLTGKSYISADGKDVFSSMRDVFRFCHECDDINDQAWLKQWATIDTPAPIDESQSIPEPSYEEVPPQWINNDTPLTPEFCPAPEIATLPNNGLSPKEVCNILVKVYVRIHHHMFHKCGWNPATGPNHNGFESPANVIQPVYVGDIPNVSKVILRMDALNELGVNKEGTPVVDSIRGHLTRGINLPRYTLYINKNTGKVVRTTILPQNKNKINKTKGGLSTWAQLALAGHCISMVMDDSTKEMIAVTETTPNGTTTYGASLYGNRIVV